MTKSSKVSSPETVSEQNLALLESSGLGDGLLATALRRHMQERRDGVVRPTALVTHNSPSRRDPNDIL